MNKEKLDNNCCQTVEVSHCSMNNACKYVIELQQENKQLKEENESMLKDLKVAEAQLNLHKILVPKCKYDDVEQQRDLYKSVIDKINKTIKIEKEKMSYSIYDSCLLLIEEQLDKIKELEEGVK